MCKRGGPRCSGDTSRALGRAVAHQNAVEERIAAERLAPSKARRLREAAERRTSKAQAAFDSSPAGIRALRALLEDASDPHGAEFDPTRQRLHDGLKTRWTEQQAHGLRSGLSPREATSAANKIVADLRTPDGGFTWNPGTGQQPQFGFAVSPYPTRSVAIRDVSNLTDAQIQRAILDFDANNADVLDQDGHFIGGWHDPQDGTVYLDVSIVTERADHARRLCLEQDQIAYFDFQTGASVTVDPTATSGQTTNEGNDQ